MQKQICELVFFTLKWPLKYQCFYICSQIIQTAWIKISRQCVGYTAFAKFQKLYLMKVIKICLKMPHSTSSCLH